MKINKPAIEKLLNKPLKLVITGALLFSLTGCGSDDSEKENKEDKSPKTEEKSEKKTTKKSEKATEKEEMISLGEPNNPLKLLILKQDSNIQRTMGYFRADDNLEGIYFDNILTKETLNLSRMANMSNEIEFYYVEVANIVSLEELTDNQIAKEKAEKIIEYSGSIQYFGYGEYYTYDIQDGNRFYFSEFDVNETLETLKSLRSQEPNGSIYGEEDITVSEDSIVKNKKK